MAREIGRRTYKYLGVVTVAFVTVLLCSNLIGVPKVSILFPGTRLELIYGTGILFFPISYVFGDVLTEVYGYAHSRKVIWSGFAALAFAAFMSWIVVHLPPAPDWEGQEALEAMFGSTPRIALASFVAYWCGEFANSYVMAKMKVWTEGRLLWTRTIGSTVVGQGVDSLIFYPIAFWGVWESHLVVQVMVTNYLLKTLLEAVLTPVTYKVIGFLKKAENEDYFDRDTNFSPFRFGS